MSIQTIIILIIVGIAAGLLSGMVGIGGGIIIVPALVYFLAFSQHKAQGTTLALLMFPIGILAVINYYKQGYVDFKYVAIIAIGFLVGSFFGSKVALSVPQENLKKIFGVFLLILAIKMLFIDKPKKSGSIPNTTDIQNAR